MSTALVSPRRSMILARALTQARRAWDRGYKEPALKLRESFGRPVGKPEGSWIADMVDLKKTIVLCDLRCKPRFDHKRAGYYMDRRFPYVSGKCDGCREVAIQCRLYIHDSFLGEGNGRIRSGQIWSPI